MTSSQSENQNEWNNAASTYRTPHIRKEYIRKPVFINELGNVQGKHILDLGCGEGYYSRLLAAAGAQVTGVDFSETFIQIAREQETTHAQGIHYVQGDITNMNFLQNNSFDAAIADFVFVTIPTQEKYISAIQETHRILKNGGMILISKGHPAKFNRPDKSKDYTVRYDNEPSYFENLTPQHIKMTINDKVAEWTNYHRTLEDFLNPWLEHGFTLTKILEPKPTDDAVAQFPNQLSGTNTLPHFIIFSLKKV